MPVMLACAASCVVSPAVARENPAPRIESLRYEIVATHPHDAASFTQGLALVDGRLAESAGLYGKSEIALREVKSGAVVRRRALDAALFGEGLAYGAGRLLQLTWREGRALAYDPHLEPAGSFRYEGEGWGLAFDGRQWLMSDGSDRITFRRTTDFAPVRRLRVTDGGRPLTNLNELEYAGGWLYANVWMTDRVAVIDPATGVVRAWLDLAALRGRFAKPRGWNPDAHVLNGIAHDPRTGHFYVTGKCWPVLFELRIAAPSP